jgi:glycosyltransferase involved in cell wall biosynthesis
MVTGAGYLFTASCTKARVLKTISQILYRIGFGCADHVIFQNDDDLKEFTVHRLCKRSKCNVVNGSGVNMYKFKPQPYPEKVSFFMLGRMLYSKGILEYIEAAKVVKKRYPNIRFMVLGKFEQMQDAIDESVVKPYINEGIVEYFPETSNVLQYYGQCSVFVLPSYREGTPRSVLEAMACSRAIITTDVPGCRSTVNDGKNGFLVPKQNIDALAVAMCKFIEMPNLIQEMGKASYDLCQAKFEVSRVNQSMLKIMDI